MRHAEQLQSTHSRRSRRRQIDNLKYIGLILYENPEGLGID